MSPSLRGASVSRVFARKIATTMSLPTIAKIAAAGSTLATLPERFDIDVAEDLDRFLAGARDASGELPALLRGWQ